MDIQDQVVRFRYYILASLLSLIAIFTLLHLAPSFVTLIVFFFPLLISTTIFLTIIILFGNTTQSHPNDAVPSFPKPAEELLDYVAGNHHPENPSDDNSEWKELPLKGEWVSEWVREKNIMLISHH